MDESLNIAHEVTDRVMGGRYEDCIIDRSSTNPVSALSKFTRLLILSAVALLSRE